MFRMRFWAFIILIANTVQIFNCANCPKKLDPIVRGSSAGIHQFPYVVRMDLEVEGEEYLCGASLIDGGWLLTAAHCVEDANSVTVHLGSTSENRSEITYDVQLSDVTIHPDYQTDDVISDIALIKIPHTDLNDKIAIVPLPKMWDASEPKYENAYAIACGWGYTETCGPPATGLLCGRFKTLSTTHCQSLNVSETEICTAMRSDLAATCNGDSGGPLVLEETGELVGITAYGDSDCTYGNLTVFTRVTSYLDWIKSVSGIYY